MIPFHDGDQSLSAEKHLEWAQTAMRQKKWKEASERWYILRRTFPDIAATWVQAAIAYRKNQDYQEAKTLLEQARIKFPNNFNVLIELTELAIVNKNYSKALELLSEVNTRFPKALIGWIKRAEVHSFMGDESTALTYNEEARSNFPHEAAPWIQYAELAMHQSDWKEALIRWSDVRKRFPDKELGYSRAAHAAEIIGETGEAKRLRLAQEFGEEVLEVKPSPEEKPEKHRATNALLELVWVKAVLNLKSEASRNKLSYLWWVFEPILFMAVFYFVFTVLLDRGGEDYVVNLLIGLVVFQWFAKGIQGASGAIVSGKGLLQQVSVEPIFFPLVSIVQTTLKHSLVFIMLFALLMISGLEFSLGWIMLIPIIVIQFLFVGVVGIFLALIVPFLRDIKQIIPIGTQFLMFVSGIFFNSKDVPEQWRQYFFFNPVANLIEQYRLTLIGAGPDWPLLMNIVYVVLLLSAVSAMIYIKFKKLYPKIVL